MGTLALLVLAPTCLEEHAEKVIHFTSMGKLSGPLGPLQTQFHAFLYSCHGSTTLFNRTVCPVKSTYNLARRHTQALTLGLDRYN